MDLVVFSTIAWDDQDGVHRPTQLARALAQRGHRVLFIQIPPVRELCPEAGIEFTSLADLGMSESEIRRAVFGFDEPNRQVAAKLPDFLKSFEQGSRRFAVLTSPFVPFIRLLSLLLARNYSIVYDCLDDFDGLENDGQYWANPRGEEFLARNADLIVIASKSLEARFRNLGSTAPIRTIPNAVSADFSPRDPVPSDLLRGKLTLGFWGPLVLHAVDLEALVYIARAQPAWAINLIGANDLFDSPYDQIQVLRGLPNVRLLGARRHEILMHYLSGFDICLLPFRANPFSRSRDPIKIYEYITAHKPIVALNAPQLAGYPNVLVTDSYKGFLESIETARKMVIDSVVADAFLKSSTWQVRAAQFESVTGNTPEHLQDESVPDLPSSFEDKKSVSERTRALLSNLEYVANERLVHIRHLENQIRPMEQHIAKLEKSHPLFILKRALGSLDRR